MKTIRIHKRVQAELDQVDVFTRSKIEALFWMIAVGKSLAMPVSRPMPGVSSGVHELRVKNAAGQIRIFYFVKDMDAVYVFHFFMKKTQQTPKHEIQIGRRRLGEMIE